MGARVHPRNVLPLSFRVHTQNDNLNRGIITYETKLLIDAIIDLGISGNFAASILGVTTASRLMRSLE